MMQYGNEISNNPWHFLKDFTWALHVISQRRTFVTQRFFFRFFLKQVSSQQGVLFNSSSSRPFCTVSLKATCILQSDSLCTSMTASLWSGPYHMNTEFSFSKFMCKINLLALRSFHFHIQGRLASCESTYPLRSSLNLKHSCWLLKTSGLKIPFFKYAIPVQLRVSV